MLRPGGAGHARPPGGPPRTLLVAALAAALEDPIGVKGGGGRMIAPAALASAVEDALSPLGVRIDEVPMTPGRIADLVEAGRARR
jgi:hypothetical protein